MQLMDPLSNAERSENTKMPYSIGGNSRRSSTLQSWPPAQEIASHGPLPVQLKADRVGEYALQAKNWLLSTSGEDLVSPELRELLASPGYNLFHQAAILRRFRVRGCPL